MCIGGTAPRLTVAANTLLAKTTPVVEIIKFSLVMHIYIIISTFTSVCSSPGPVLSFPSHLRASLHLEVQEPNQTTAEQGKVELRILNFKTTWSEYQKPSHTAAEQGKAKLCILNFKTTWSELQKPIQITAEQGKAELRILNFKIT